MLHGQLEPGDVTCRVSCGCVQGRVNKLPWKTEGSTIYQFRRAAPNVLFDCCVNPKEDSGECLHPLVRVGLCLQDCLELSMKPLNHTIGKWVVSRGSDTGGSQQHHELSPKSRFELGSTVSGHSIWSAKRCYPTTDECSCHRFSCDMLSGTPQASG